MVQDVVDPTPCILHPRPYSINELSNSQCCRACTGVSLSSGRGSTLNMNHLDVAEAAELRVWYDTVGRNATHVPAGEGLATARCAEMGPENRAWDGPTFPSPHRHIFSCDSLKYTTRCIHTLANRFRVNPDDGDSWC